MNILKKSNNSYEKIELTGKKDVWLQAFENQIEIYQEEEDFLHNDYKIPDGKQDTYIYKGKYNKGMNEIVIIQIYCKFSFLNHVTKFKGRFIDENERIYLAGKIESIYPNYIKELLSTPGVFFVLPFWFIGIFLNKNFLFNLMLILILMILLGYIDSQWMAVTNKKVLLKKIIEMSVKS